MLHAYLYTQRTIMQHSFSSIFTVLGLKIFGNPLKPGVTEIEQSKSQLFTTLAVSRPSETSCGVQLRGLASGQHRFELRRNVAAVVGCRQHCVQFDCPRNRTQDLPQR